MPNSIRIRMYNVGFGDCFLLEFPTGVIGEQHPPFRVLVDCGAHRSGYPRADWRPDNAARDVIADLAGNGAPPRLDIVVATHRHQDHVSGFAANAWREVEVGQVWMPWTEKPDDREATDIRERQSRLAHGLQLAFAGGSSFAARWADADGESLRAIVRNSLTNEAAMRTLHHGFRGAPDREFLAAGSPPVRIEPKGCPDLTVHVLGPSRDRDVIRDMDPPVGQSYLRYLVAARNGRPEPAAAAAAAAKTGNQRPFARHFALAPEEFESDASRPAADAKTKAAAMSAMRDDDLAVAVSLDKAVNGTSLMLVFEFRGACLLFPGDAQWGTWNAALGNPASRELLSRTTFYKVGHHGSHNATPVEFLDEVLPVGAPMWGAATSVHPVAIWPEIPRDQLLDALRGHAERVVRSDQPDAAISGIEVRPDIGVDFQVPCRDR